MIQALKLSLVGHSTKVQVTSEVSGGQNVMVTCLKVM